jgi:predicted nuclease with RNAse H fold
VDSSTVVLGIDVGGIRKGFHAVALRGGKYLDKTRATSAVDIDRWCRELRPGVVAIDAPCRWSADGRARPAERALMAQRIACFATPTRVAAETHPKNYFGWMLAGAELYGLLEERYALYDGRGSNSNRPVCFETFPQAIACAIAGERVSAKRKCTVRRALLQKVDVDTSALTNIDTVDAALCAWAAEQFVRGETVAHGEVETGFIVVPTTTPSLRATPP